MKKTILHFITCILCALFFTGCPHETPVNQSAEAQKTEPEVDKYPREIIFDKETFDAQRKAWEESGIKKYRFTQIYYRQNKELLCRITVKDGVETEREFFWNSYDNPETFENYVTLEDFPDDYWDPDPETRYEQEEEIKHLPNYMPEVFLYARNTVPITKIDDIFTKINKWYEEAKNKDFVAEKIADCIIFVEYHSEKSLPINYYMSIESEEEYDHWEKLDSESQDDEIVFNMKYWHFGWQEKIYDFEVLE